MSAELELIARLKNEAKAGLASLKSDIKDVGTAVDQTDTKVKGLSSTMKVGLAAGAVIGTAAVVALGKGLQFSVQQAAEAEAVQADLAQTIASTGGAAGLTLEQLNDMAGGLQNVTTFGDEAIGTGQAMLLTFTNIGSEVFPRATEAMLDMAQKFGSVDAAAIQVGKALNDPIRGLTALRKVGVGFTEEQEEMIRVLQESGDMMGAQTVILDELARQFGGQARAAAETFTGRMQQVENQVGEAGEMIGNSLIPALTMLAEETIPAVQEAIEAATPAFEQFGEDATRQITLMAESGAWNRLQSEVAQSGVNWLELNRVIGEGKAGLDLWRTSADLEEDVDRQRIGIIRMNAALRALNLGLEAGSDEFFAYIEAAAAAEIRAQAMTDAYGDLTGATAEVTGATAAFGGASLETGRIIDDHMIQALKDASIAAGDLTMTTDGLIDRTDEYFRAAVPAIENTDSWAAEMYEAAEAAGASAQELAILGTGLGLYSSEAAEAALQSAAIQIKINELAQAYADGELSVAGMRSALQLFIQQLTGELPDSVQGGIDIIDALKGKAEDASGTYGIHFEITQSGEIPQPQGGGATGGGTGNLPAPGEPTFQEGGYTGKGFGIAGFVHRKEFVFDEVSTRNAGVANLEQMQKQLRQGPLNTQAAGGDFIFSPTINISGGGGNTAEIERVVLRVVDKVARDAEQRWRMRR